MSEGGAFQISLSRLQVDFYPYHLAVGNRSAWIRYQESVHSTWLANGIAAFQSTLLDALTSADKIHTRLSRSGGGGGGGEGGAKTSTAPVRNEGKKEWSITLATGASCSFQLSY